MEFISCMLTNKNGNRKLINNKLPECPLILQSEKSKKQPKRIFQEIVVEYPSYNTYPEYKGKPYFSIKYMENGQKFIGYGTYKPEVLSEYLKEYFIPSVQPKIICCQDCVWYLKDKNCARHMKQFKPDDFCSEAIERKTDD